MASKKTAKPAEEVLYTGEDWTEETMRAELISRGFEESDVADAEEDELRSTLIADDAESEDEEVSETPEETNTGGVQVDNNEFEADAEEKNEEDTTDLVPPAKPVARATKGGSVVVLKGYADGIKGSAIIREYSLETHGEDYLALAESFTGKGEFRLVSSSEINIFRVSARVKNIKLGKFINEAHNYSDFATAYEKFSSYNVKSNPVITAE